MRDMNEHEQVRQLSGLRRALYHAARSRGLSHERAYRTAAARCCDGGSVNGHAEWCENNGSFDV